MTVTRVPASNPEPEVPTPAINREGVNELLSMPYDEPDMDEVERACDEVRHEVPITDPRWLVSTQPEPTPEIDGGLDGRGTTHAADLPASAHVWGHLAAPVDYNDDLEAEAPVRRERCLLVDPDGDYLMPGRCKKPLGHEEPHDWGANHGAFLGETRRAELRDTPSGRLPVRTPGAALEEEREVIERWPA